MTRTVRGSHLRPPAPAVFRLLWCVFFVFCAVLSSLWYFVVLTYVLDDLWCVCGAAQTCGLRMKRH